MPQGTGKVTQPQLLNLRKNAKTWTEKHPEEEVVWYNLTDNNL